MLFGFCRGILSPRVYFFRSSPGLRGYRLLHLIIASSLPMQKNQNQTRTLAITTAPDYFDFDLYINMISTLILPEQISTSLAGGLHVRENKILLDFLFYLKYNFSISGNNKIKFKEVKNDIFKLTIFSM